MMQSFPSHGCRDLANGSFLILTHVNTNDVDGWFISVRATIGRELSKTWLYLGCSFPSAHNWKAFSVPYLQLSERHSPEANRVANKGETQYCLTHPDNYFPLEANTASLNMIPLQHNTVSLLISYCITPSFITHCSSSYLTLQSCRATSLLGRQMSGVWSSGMDL